MTCAALGLVAWGASAQTATSLDAKVQAPQLAAPERGSLVGPLATTAFGPADVSRGGFQLPSVLGLPSERGAALASVLPTYSPESGLGEWGMGWQSTLELTRWRVLGDLDYATDEVTGPWGRMVKGQDGDWYPLGLSAQVRLRQAIGGTWTAYLPDGTRWTFGATRRVDTAKGTYAWALEEVQSAVGRKTKLEYVANTSGRLFLKTLRYGGTGDDFQYRVDFNYEPLARPVTDLSSGQALVLDQRVKEVVVLALSTASGAFEERWRETLTYEDDAQGPAFYLTQVQRTYASGQQPPAVHYSYNKPAEQLAAAQLRRNTKLDAVLSQWGTDAFQPNRSALFDINLDGRPDAELAVDNTLLTAGDTGFTAEPLPAMSSSASPACRSAPSTLNQPRVLAQMRASEDTQQVVALRANSARTQTTLTVCARSGDPFGTQTLTGDWTLNSNTRLVDINRDQQPDLVRVSAGRVTILPNTSNGTGYGFGASKVVTLSPTFTPDTSWVHDVNGDGIADIVSRGGSGSLSVWLGKGNYSFETAARTFQLRGSSGVPLSSLSDYDITFLDANKDGLADVLLNRISSTGAYLYLNTGTAFTQVQVPALQAMTGIISRPLAVDLAGTGDMEVAYVVSGQAYSLALAGAQTALMNSADDGKGTVLHFEYIRGPATPGTHQRHALLGALVVESSGYDTVRYTYAYEGPTLHSVARFLVGFGSVTRTGPGLVTASSFLNGDAFSGLLSSSTQHDTLSSGVHTYEYRQYEDALFQGIPWKRLKEEGSGFAQDDGQAVGERLEYVSYENEVCPAVTVRHLPNGTLTTQKWRASLPGLADHLHCMESNTRVTGSHGDATLDFENEVRLTRNAVGLVEKVEDLAPTDTLTLQDVVYRPDFLVDHISVPGRGTTYFEWQPGTLQLSRVTSPEGMVMEATSSDPLTSAPLAITTWRGGAPLVRQFRYDGLERLAKQWDNLGGATEAVPNLQLAYRYATATQPGSITATTLVDAALGITRTELEWQTAAGEGVAKAARIPEGWKVDGLTTRNRNLLETKLHVRPTLSASTDAASLDYAGLLAGADVLNTLSTSGLGFEADVLSRLHVDVSRHVETHLSIDGGALVRESVENGTQTVRSFLDAQKRVVAYEDEAHTRYDYTYDAAGRLRRVALPDGRTHRVSFDEHGRPARVDRDGVASVTYTYEPVTGLLHAKTFLSPAGQPLREEASVFDTIGRKLQDVHTDLATGDSRTYRYHYDGATPDAPNATGSLGFLTAVEGEGYQKLLSYRVDGKLTHRTLRLLNWRAVDTSITYREDGSVQQTQECATATPGTPSCTTVANTADGYGRTATNLLNGGLMASLGYDANGQLASASLAGGGWIAFSYDALTRAPSGFTQATPQLTSSVDWRLNARGLLDSETLDVGALQVQRVYGYSAQRFLASSTDAQGTYGYNYDATGLPSRIEENGTARDLVTSGGTLQAGGVTYTFDALGRTVTKGDLTFTYGPHGHLSRATRGTQSWDYLYDEAGDRLLKLQGGVPVAAYLDDGAYLDGTGLTIPYRLGGRLLGVIQGGAFRPLATDARGTVLSDFDGTPRTASPYGSRAVHPESAAALDYVEKGYDADLGLIRMGVRDYDPAISRFLTPDPLFLESLEKGVGSPIESNLYGYARSNPLSFTDPTGFESDERGESRASSEQRIDNRPAGMSPPESRVQHLRNDWAGRFLLERWLSGTGDLDIKDESRWTDYMKADDRLRVDLQLQLITFAQAAIQADPNGRSVNFNLQFHAEIENGEGIVGYQYLHGTDNTVGDFQIKGEMTIIPQRGDRGEINSWRVLFQNTYRWNDMIDPNRKYSTDTFKSGVGKVISLNQAKDYRISITWQSTAMIELANDPMKLTIGDNGWPFTRK